MIPKEKKTTARGELVVVKSVPLDAQPQNEILRSRGLGGAALNKQFVAVWIATSIACRFLREMKIASGEK